VFGLYRENSRAVSFLLEDGERVIIITPFHIVVKSQFRGAWHVILHAGPSRLRRRELPRLALPLGALSVRLRASFILFALFFCGFIKRINLLSWVYHKDL
jgi:hypothetical protein